MSNWQDPQATAVREASWRVQGHYPIKEIIIPPNALASLQVNLLSWGAVGLLASWLTGPIRSTFWKSHLVIQYVYVLGGTRTHMDSRGQVWGVSYLLLCGSPELNSNPQSWQKVPLPTESDQNVMSLAQSQERRQSPFFWPGGSFSVMGLNKPWYLHFFIWHFI